MHRPMSERKALRLAWLRLNQAEFLCRMREIAQAVADAEVDRRATLARDLADAESLFKEPHHGSRACSYYVDSYPAQASPGVAEVGRR